MLIENWLEGVASRIDLGKFTFPSLAVFSICSQLVVGTVRGERNVFFPGGFTERRL